MLIGLVQEIGRRGKHLFHIMGGEPAGVLRIDPCQILKVFLEVLIPLDILPRLKSGDSYR